jgi:D-alanyl-D-alanine carboxypeptidase
MQAILMRVGLAVAMAATFALAPAQDAAARQYAAVVMDARNGDVLHARNADTRLHPASLTKMMTLYLVIEAVEQGRLDLDQRVAVSRHAARQPASKVGFRAGQRVRIRDLIRSAAVRSANDSAVVLAEAISGSEAEFAGLMTRRAREMGMTRTTFRNASGLTAEGHLSTARDMAVLGRHVIYDYPEYYNLFGRRSTRAFGKTIWTTNKLLGSYNGADGIKTGYTRAAGFNLVASAERGTERVLVSLFGGRSAVTRNAEVARLLDLGFDRAPRVAEVIPPVMMAALRAPVPAARPGARAGDPSLFVASARAVGSAFVPAAAHASQTAGPAAPGLHDVTEFAPVMARRPARRPGSAVAAAGDWAVRLGAYAEREMAVARLAAAAFGVMPELAQAERDVDVLGDGANRRYVGRLKGLDVVAALEACRLMAEQGWACTPEPPALD